MHWERLAAIICLLISIINGILAVFIYQRRQQPGAKGFFGLMITIMIYSFGYAFELTGDTVAQAKFWLHFEYLGITFIPFFWMVIVFSYAGLEGRIRPWILTALFMFSLTSLIIYTTNDLHHLFYSDLVLKKHDAFRVATVHRELWYWINLTYMALALFAGDIILFQIKERSAPLFRKQINFLIFGSLIPWFGYIIFLAGISPWGLDLSPFSFSLTGSIAAWELFRYKLFDLSPIARDKTFETMRDGVLILDLQNRVADFNRAVQSFFPDLNSSRIGHTLRDVLQDYPALLDQVLKAEKLREFEMIIGGERKCIHSQLNPALSELREPIGKIVILSDVTEQKQAQIYLIHAEKIAVLGQLASNITQELNAPLVAIKSAAEEVDGFLAIIWRQLPDFFNQMSEESRRLFMELLDKLQNIPYLTTREERDSMRKLNPVLQEQGIDDRLDLIRYFVKLGLTDDFVRWIPIIRDHRDAALLELVLGVALQRRDARTILQAEEKTAKIAYVLKSYGQTPDEGKPVLTDIRSGVEAILRMYGNLMKNGIKTMTEFQKVPPIYAYPDQLQQVWTNLIHNAIQAMEGKGELIIRIEPNDDQILVSFIDNGPGIPQENLQRIFEPLFTTKKLGEGTGMGLSICRKIVERHHGKITVQSRPGKTQFLICLPLKGMH